MPVLQPLKDCTVGRVDDPLGSTLFQGTVDLPFSLRAGGLSPGFPVSGPPGPSLSVLVPAFNEEATVVAALRRVLVLPGIDLEVIVVDDGSTDRTASLVASVASQDSRVRLFRHAENRGKGAAIRTALDVACGDLAVIQDADLENDPRDLLRMLARFDDPCVSVVYGSRWLHKGQNPTPLSTYLPSAFLTWITNRLFGSHLTDEPTCYKMFKAHVLRGLDCEATGFEFCPEVTAKVLLAGHQIVEVPVSYAPRTRREGKKIRWRDGAVAVVTLLRNRFFTNQRSKRRSFQGLRTVITRLQTSLESLLGPNLPISRRGRRSGSGIA